MNKPIGPTPGRWTKTSVDQFAGEMFGKFGLTAGGDLSTLIKKLGGDIKYGWESLDEYAGGSITVRDYNDFTIVLSDMTSHKRDRFTIAHELGHLFLHFGILRKSNPKVIMRATREKRTGDPDHERAEWEANWFAAGFLMPADLFRDKARELNDNQLATYFDVSEAAVNVRKKTLGI